MSTYAVFKLELEVDDPQALYNAALEYAVNVDCMLPEHAVNVLRGEDNEIDIAACIGMLLDPGSLPGCSIDHHEVELPLGLGDDE